MLTIEYMLCMLYTKKKDAKQMFILYKKKKKTKEKHKT